MPLDNQNYLRPRVEFLQLDMKVLPENTYEHSSIYGSYYYNDIASYSSSNILYLRFVLITWIGHWRQVHEVLDEVFTYDD